MFAKSTAIFKVIFECALDFLEPAPILSRSTRLELWFYAGQSNIWI